MSSLMRRTSPRMAARCSRVSPRSFLLFTLSLVLEAEFGVPFWPPLDCDWCFGVVSEDKTFRTCYFSPPQNQNQHFWFLSAIDLILHNSLTWCVLCIGLLGSHKAFSQFAMTERWHWVYFMFVFYQASTEHKKLFSKLGSMTGLLT